MDTGGESEQYLVRSNVIFVSISTFLFGMPASTSAKSAKLNGYRVFHTLFTILECRFAFLSGFEIAEHSFVVSRD